MSEQYQCSECGVTLSEIPCPRCKIGKMVKLRWTKGGNGSHWAGCEEVHYDCKIASLEEEVDRLKAYSMKLLSEESRVWECECGFEFTSTYKGELVISKDIYNYCPQCQRKAARLQSDILKERIEKLKSALTKIAYLRDDWSSETDVIADLQNIAKEALK